MNWPLWLRCRHPFSSLSVYKPQTEEVLDEEFTLVTYHFLCDKCCKRIDKKFVRFNGDVDEFLDKFP